MTKNQQSFLKKLSPNLTYYFILLMLLNVLLFLTKPDYAYIGIALSLILISYTVYKIIDARKNWKQFTDKMDADLFAGSQSSLLSMPLPLVILSTEGNILWYNSRFKGIIETEKSILGDPIQSLFLNWDWKAIKDSKDNFIQQNIQNRSYRVFQSVQEDQGVHTFYWLDDTEHKQLEKVYDEEKTMLMYVQVDNFDEIISSAQDGMSPFIISEINATLKRFAHANQAILHKIDDDEYILVLHKKYLDTLEAKKFSILDDIRNINAGNRNPITLSIGVSRDGKSLTEREHSSKTAMELALGRGGDQAVVRKDNNYDFFGGRSKNVERINRVRSRMIAQGLATLITEAEQIFIMGHRYPDLDSFAASIGVLRCVKNLEKEASIVLNEVTEPIRDVFEFFKNDPDYRFIRSAEVKSKTSPKSLLIIVDTHRPTFTDDPDIIPLFNKKVVIDHHRRGTEIVENPALMYLEPYASSTSEMVTELIQYISERPTIEPEEANTLLSGIILDTKNFVFNTGVRTFDAASFLRRNGADTLLVREIFKDKMEESIIKSGILSNSVEVHEGVALSVNETAIDNVKKLISQGADELIDIRNIHTSFVIGKDLEDTVYISARSTGECNVQVILEKLGGGGHLETAGAQFKDKSIAEVKELLIKQIDHYLEGK